MWQVNHSESFNRVVLVQHDNLTFELQVHIDMRLALDAADAGNTSSGFPLSQVKVSCATSSATVMAVRAVSDSFPQGTVMANEQPQVNTVPVSAVADPVRSLAPNGAPVVQVAPTAPVAPNAIPAVVPVSVGMPATPKAGNTSALPTGSVVSAAPAALMTSATASVSASARLLNLLQLRLWILMLRQRHLHHQCSLPLRQQHMLIRALLNLLSMFQVDLRIYKRWWMRSMP